MPAKLKVTLIKSPISHTQRTRATMSALGLHRIGQSVVIDDTPEMRGMTRAIRFLLRTEPTDGAETAAKAKSAARKKEASKS
ncbi:MAG TPA: 50S ribosomal protein L30 [Candidatus Limnocylindrales bacterium]|jgi:large subunit ribosomal protein L30